MTNTKHFGLLIASRDDKFDIEFFNKNMRLLDEAMKAVDDRTAAVSPVVDTNVGNQVSWSVGEVKKEHEEETTLDILNSIILNKGYENFDFLLKDKLPDFPSDIVLTKEDGTKIIFKISVIGHKDGTEEIYPDPVEGETDEDNSESVTPEIKIFSNQFTIILESLDPSIEERYMALYDKTCGLLSSWTKIMDLNGKMKDSLVTTLSPARGSIDDLLAMIIENIKSFNNFTFPFIEELQEDVDITVDVHWTVSVTLLEALESGEKTFYVTRSMAEDPHTVLGNIVDDTGKFEYDRWEHLYPIDVPDIPVEHWSLKSSLTVSEVLAHDNELIEEDAVPTNDRIHLFPFIHYNITADADCTFMLSNLFDDNRKIGQYIIRLTFGDDLCEVKILSDLFETRFVWMNSAERKFEANHEYLITIYDGVGLITDINPVIEEEEDPKPEENEGGENSGTNSNLDWERVRVSVPSSEQYMDLKVDPYKYTVFEGPLGGDGYYFELDGDPIRESGRVAQYKFQFYIGNHMPETIVIGSDGNTEFINRQIKKYVTKIRTFYLVEIIEDFCNITVYPLSEEEEIKKEPVTEPEEEEDEVSEYDIGGIHIVEEPINLDNDNSIKASNGRANRAGNSEEVGNESK